MAEKLTMDESPELSVLMQDAVNICVKHRNQFVTP